jgi:predicted amidophosphoribosyltransferase
MNTLSAESQRVYNTITKFGPIRAAQIVKMLGISTKTVYKHLASLQDEQLISKSGSTPKVFYQKYQTQEIGFNNEEYSQIIEQNYLYVSPTGDLIRGVNGLKTWCLKNKFDFEQEKLAYIGKIKQVSKLKQNGVLSAKKTILSGKNKLYLDNIYFSDFYTLDYFGKTKLGQLVYVGKTSQNKNLIREVAGLIKPSMLPLITKLEIQYVCFIPPTIERKVQFVNMLKKSLRLDLPEIIAVKVPSNTKVAQKTLRKLEDRIENAQKTIAVNPNQIINGNVLIIDDATGSGATLNETAKKIKTISPTVKVYGYSVVGSYKGFDVISEV